MPIKTFTSQDVAAATQPQLPPGAPKMNVMGPPMPGQDTLCCAIISINGALQSMNVYCKDDATLYRSVSDIVGRRNAHIKHEDTRIVEMWFGCTPEFAQAKADEVRAANKDGRLASDIFPDEPSRILSTPITDAPEGYDYF